MLSEQSRSTRWIKQLSSVERKLTVITWSSTLCSKEEVNLSSLISHFTDYYPHVDKARVCAQSLKQMAYCNLSVSVQYFSMDKPWDKHENFFHRAIIVSNMNLDHRTLMP